MEKYEVKKQIRGGRTGDVYVAENSVTKETVALNKICVKGDKGVPGYLIREVSLLTEIEHSNIISEKSVYLVSERMDLDLHEFINTNRNIARSPLRIKRFLHQILSSLAYCHSNKIIHRDLKPANLLLNSKDKILKLADFGSARDFGVPPKIYTREGEVGGSLWYMAPEIMLGCPNYSAPVDVWSVGCILAEMVNGTALFDGRRQYEQVKKKFSEVVPGLEPAEVDLLSKMLCMNPRGRITARDAMEHAYFEDVRKP